MGRGHSLAIDKERDLLLVRPPGVRVWRDGRDGPVAVMRVLARGFGAPTPKSPPLSMGAFMIRAPGQELRRIDGLKE